MRVGGIVLCGGRSSRMGRPKAWLPFGVELMLQRVVRVVRAAADPVVVVAAPGQDVPPLPPEVEVVRDEVEGKGPLGGLAAGLAALDGKADAAYLSSCDVPFLKPEFVERVVSFLGSGDRQVDGDPSADPRPVARRRLPSRRSATTSTRSPRRTACRSAPRC
jgi:molybdopterin-guanine dinucleotide biosynthesis protein A